jgi:apolipoprotein N-acyltransferase
MLNWIKQNLIQIMIAMVLVTFGYAHFIGKTENQVQALELRVDKYEEKIDQAIKLLERIDERTKKL